MFTLPADLDAWADRLASATGLAVTSDPGTIAAPCVFVGLPDTVNRATLTAIGVAVPVWLLTDQPGKVGRDQLLTGLPLLLGAAPEGTSAAAGVLTVGGTEWRGYVLTVNIRFIEGE